MCDVCVATGRMTVAEWDQIQAAEREQDLGTLIQVSGGILEREEARRAGRAAAVETPEDIRENETLDRVLASLIELAKDYDQLPLKQAHKEMASALAAETSQAELAYGLAALITRLWRNA